MRDELSTLAGGIAGTAGLVVVLFAGDALAGYDGGAFAALGAFVGAQPDPVVGFVLFAAIGVFAWPLVYLSLREYLPGDAPAVRGAVFAAPLWVGYAVVFGFGADTASPGVFLLVTLLGHLAYGALLGFVAGRLGDGDFGATA